MDNSHRRVDMGVTVGNCGMYRLLFADELVSFIAPWWRNRSFQRTQSFQFL